MKKYLYNTVLALGIFALFAGGTHAVMAQKFTTKGITASLFELAPKQISYKQTHTGLSTTPTTNSNTVFRLLGSSVFDAMTASGDARFDNLLVGPGYTNASIPTKALQVDGAIQIAQLADPLAMGNTAYLCVNDFGVLSRCPGSAAAGAAVCKAHPMGTSQLATDTASGCVSGRFFDMPDTINPATGFPVYNWACRAASESLAMTIVNNPGVENPTLPTDVACSHEHNALTGPGGGPVTGGGGSPVTPGPVSGVGYVAPPSPVCATTFAGFNPAEDYTSVSFYQSQGCSDGSAGNIVLGNNSSPTGSFTDTWECTSASQTVSCSQTLNTVQPVCDLVSPQFGPEACLSGQYVDLPDEEEHDAMGVSIGILKNWRCINPVADLSVNCQVLSF